MKHCAILLSLLVLLGCAQRPADAPAPITSSATWQDLLLGCWIGRGDQRPATGVSNQVFFEVMRITKDDEHQIWHHATNVVEVDMKKLSIAAHPHDAMRVGHVVGPVNRGGLTMLLGPVGGGGEAVPHNAQQSFELRLSSDGNTMSGRRMPGVGPTVYFDRKPCQEWFEQINPIRGQAVLADGQ